MAKDADNPKMRSAGESFEQRVSERRKLLHEAQERSVDNLDVKKIVGEVTGGISAAQMGQSGRLPGNRHYPMSSIGSFFSLSKVSFTTTDATWVNVKLDAYTEGDKKSFPKVKEFVAGDNIFMTLTLSSADVVGFEFTKFTKSAWYLHFHTTVHRVIGSSGVVTTRLELGICPTYAASPSASPTLLHWLKQKYAERQFDLGSGAPTEGSGGVGSGTGEGTTYWGPMSIGGVIVPSVDLTDNKFSIIAKATAPTTSLATAVSLVDSSLSLFKLS